MNDTKVVRYDPDSSAYGYFLGMRKAEYGDYVTHADYRALEEENDDLHNSVKDQNDRIERLKQEHDSLLARVGELVDADRAFDVCIASQVIDDKVYDRRQAALGVLE